IKSESHEIHYESHEIHSESHEIESESHEIHYESHEIHYESHEIPSDILISFEDDGNGNNVGDDDDGNGDDDANDGDGNVDENNAKKLKIQLKKLKIHYWGDLFGDNSAARESFGMKLVTPQIQAYPKKSCETFFLCLIPGDKLFTLNLMRFTLNLMRFTLKSHEIQSESHEIQSESHEIQSESHEISL
ncbi:hypothetical protein Tco_0962910, partial [Tanacetum coccineum]